ncbi:hypothetical protein FC777_11255 [Clostridium botulinum]|nr:hypothetical protein [Clostridium botulinum]
MNKFQKLAVKCAKNDIKKPKVHCIGFGNFKLLKAMTLNMFLREKYPYKKALGFKNWSKNQEV